MADYFPTPEETAECGYCGYRGNVNDFRHGFTEHETGSVCPQCDFVEDFPPTLDEEDLKREMRAKQEIP